MTSLLVALLGQARIYVVLGREALLPACFARIHPTRDTPARAAVFTGATAGAPYIPLLHYEHISAAKYRVLRQRGARKVILRVLIIAGVLALLVDINTLAQLVSIGTLFVFFMVSAGVIQVRPASCLPSCLSGVAKSEYFRTPCCLWHHSASVASAWRGRSVMVATIRVLRRHFCRLHKVSGINDMQPLCCSGASTSRTAA